MRSAMILAAGLGTRLRPLTDEVPKPLVPVGDAPALVQIQKHLARFGVERAVVNTHYLADRFAGVDWALPTTLLHESSILGTAGGVAHALGQLDRRSPLLVWNGDILADLDVDALDRALASSDAVAAWSVAPRPRGEGTVGLDEQGRVVRLRDARRGVEARGGDFLGVQVMSPALLGRLPSSGCVVGDVLVPWLREGAVIQTVEHRGPWDDIGSLDAYLRANLRWLGERASFVGPGATCSVTLDQSLLGAQATVSGEGTLQQVVVWPGAHAQAPLRRAVVTGSGRIVSLDAAQGP